MRAGTVRRDSLSPVKDFLSFGGFQRNISLFEGAQRDHESERTTDLGRTISVVTSVLLIANPGSMSSLAIYRPSRNQRKVGSEIAWAGIVESFGKPSR